LLHVCIPLRFVGNMAPLHVVGQIGPWTNLIMAQICRAQRRGDYFLVGITTGNRPEGIGE
jgi:hypothetical protein